MTRAQRKMRTRKERAASAGLVLTFAGDRSRVLGLTENPNTGKRHASNATHRLHGLTEAERERIKSARRAYVPLTVHTPIKRARIAPKTTHYTI